MLTVTLECGNRVMGADRDGLASEAALHRG
jgi:hypothetical protein